MNNYSQKGLLLRLRPCLVNCKNKARSVAFYCPFCQASGLKKNGRQWPNSKRKGYIFINENSGYQHYVFCCQNSCCESRRLRTGKGGISLENFARHILGDLDRIPSFNDLRLSAKPAGKSVNPGCSATRDPKPDQPDSPKKTTYNRVTPQQQAGSGGMLDKKLKQRKDSRKGYWDRI